MYFLLIFVIFYFCFFLSLSWKAGVASSLNYIKIDENKQQSPILTPYPSWDANKIDSDGPREVGVVERTGGHDSAAQATVSNVALANNASIISTFRIRVDECDRLWVMDSGLADILGEPKQIAPPALVIFDLNTDQLIKRYAFKPEDSKAGTFFANVVCETDDWTIGIHSLN